VTPRRTPAHVLVRLLAVVGGAFVLLILGAAAAGAAGSNPAAVRAEQPSPAPNVSVSVPAVVAPILHPVAVSVPVPGGRLDIGGPGGTVALDAPVLVPVPALPSAPAVPALPTVPSLPDAPGPATPTGAAPEAHPTADRAHALHASAPASIAATVRAADRAPAPAPPGDPRPEPPLTLALAATALGLQVSTRHGGLDDAGVTGTCPHALRRLLALGRAARVRALDPRPGFHLLLARPG